MKTLEKFMTNIPQLPLSTVWILNDLAEYRGKQELFTRQSPQKLKALREHALIESAVASNRIEGVEVSPGRVGTVIFGKGHLQDRGEQEVRGYQTALNLVHELRETLPVTPDTILKLHDMIRPGLWDSGEYKEKDGEIIEKHADGTVSVRFKPLSAGETPDAVNKMCENYNFLQRDREIPTLVLWGAMNLDFLCIHPFRDGNGRVSRILLLLTLYHLGFTAGRFISLERIIERSKERYYETLKISSLGWHEGRHDPWPYINYILFSLKELYEEFEERYNRVSPPHGEKTKSVQRALERFITPFHINELRHECPEVSLDMIRKVLKDMASEGKIQCLGRGKQAKWRVIR